MPAWATILLFAVSVVSVIVFPAVEKRAKHLLIPMAFFRDRTFTVEILTASVLGGAQMAFEVYSRPSTICRRRSQACTSRRARCCG